ncbi:cucumisin-like [Tripterygium wilfordii]|uniref:Cucumisin-like n=1 Tax=Tripterygium wilfordii TaxID=458696 RepID=A0A7J7C743_TRIWF|nr:cucumisin-like [Tripterygium wilfordii]
MHKDQLTVGVEEDVADKTQIEDDGLEDLWNEMTIALEVSNVFMEFSRSGDIWRVVADTSGDAKVARVYIYCCVVDMEMGGRFTLYAWVTSLMEILLLHQHTTLCYKVCLAARSLEPGSTTVKMFMGKTDLKSPRDSDGHGTPTSSTTAGKEVIGESFFGLADGTARGGVPGYGIAVYKVCWFRGCSSADILAAFDDAIADGVDIISVSDGPESQLEYMEDPITIGSFHAMKYGILTSTSAGNAGPSPATVSYYAPSTMTVAANTIDRKFVTPIGSYTRQRKSLNYARNYSAGADLDSSKNCLNGALNSYKVEGKLLNFFSNPVATIPVSEAWKDATAPSIVIFSSRGPNPISLDILKGYNTAMLRLIINDSGSCGSSKPGRAWDLNYPSFSLAIEDGL